MASQTQTGKVVPDGFNEVNKPTISCVLSSALASTNTLTLQLPPNVDFNLVPIWFRAYSTAQPAVELSGPAEANLRITSHNTSTGTTVLTAAGAGIASGAKVLVGYAPMP